MSWIDDIEAEQSNASSSSPLSDLAAPFAEPKIVECTDCSKPVLASAIEPHRENCRKAREKALGTSNGSQQQRRASVSPQKKRRLSDASNTALPPKKVKASTPVPSTATNSPAPTPASNAPRPPIQRKNSKKQGGNNKSKLGPVDPNTQCCVLNENGTPCSRSLTCKSHSMASKRAVNGRTATYDVLLKEYNEKHNPNFGLKKTNSNQGTEKETAVESTMANTNVSTMQKKKSPKKNKENEVSLIYGDVSDSETKSGAEDGADSGLDSEEEVEAVLAGLEGKFARPFPGLRDPFQSSYLVKDVRISRYRESLAGAILSKGL